jgi:ribosomal protein L32
MEVKILDKKETEMRNGLQGMGMGFMGDYLAQARELMEKQKKLIAQLEDCPKCGGKMRPCKLRCKDCGYETEKITR